MSTIPHRLAEKERDRIFKRQFFIDWKWVVVFCMLSFAGGLMVALAIFKYKGYL